MKTPLILLVFALSGGCVLAQAPKPCDTEGHRQFHFWIGDWAVYDTSGKQVGENRVDLILGECVLAENWTSASGSQGKSYNSYDPTSNTWYQTWVDQQGSTIHFEGHWLQNKMVFRAEQADSSGTIMYRMSFTPQEDGSVIQNWKATRDLEQWTTLFNGIYRRKP